MQHLKIGLIACSSVNIELDMYCIINTPSSLLHASLFIQEEHENKKTRQLNYDFSKEQSTCMKHLKLFVDYMTIKQASPFLINNS